MPTFPPVVGNTDCRTSSRIAYWNEEAVRMVREHNDGEGGGEWSVVDVGAYSRPVQEDMRLFDSTHCAFFLLLFFSIPF
jgi:hypothetical protein